MTRQVTNGGLTLHDKKTFDDEVCYLSHTNIIIIFTHFFQEFHQMQHKFDEIISELPAYGPTLAKIKVHTFVHVFLISYDNISLQSVYESVMKSIRDFHRVHSVVQLRDSQMMVQAATMR